MPTKASGQTWQICWSKEYDKRYLDLQIRSTRRLLRHCYRIRGLYCLCVYVKLFRDWLMKLDSAAKLNLVANFPPLFTIIQLQHYHSNNKFLKLPDARKTSFVISHRRKFSGLSRWITFYVLSPVLCKGILFLNPQLRLKNNFFSLNF